MGLAVIAVDSIPLLGLAEVMPVVMSERDPQVPASQSHDVAAGGARPARRWKEPLRLNVSRSS